MTNGQAAHETETVPAWMYYKEQIPRSELVYPAVNTVSYITGYDVGKIAVTSLAFGSIQCGVHFRKTT